MEVTNFEETLVKTYGLRGLKNQAVTNAVLYALRKMKTHFGVDMKIQEPSQVKAATKWIERYDKNFKSHISNPYMLNSKIAYNDPIIEGTFIIKLTKATWVLVSGRTNRVDRNTTSTSNELTMYIFGKKAFKYFRNLTKHIEYASNSSQMMYSITASGGDSNRTFWSCAGSTLTPRPMDTLFFDDGIKDRIKKHLDNWLSNEGIYAERGLIYKTGILLYGTPGTGKSSLASAIANYLHCGLITIDCTTFQYLNTAEVAESINADEDRYVVLLDEIDSIFGNRDEETDDEKNKRISKLLSFLDSPNSPNNVVFVATTNYIDRLDKAVLRKGRFDIAEELTDIHKEAAYEMCRSFNLSDDDINRIMSKAEFPMNPSTLQDAILNTIKKEAVL